jgi:hypothetical protein
MLLLAYLYIFLEHHSKPIKKKERKHTQKKPCNWADQAQHLFLFLFFYIL